MSVVLSLDPSTIDPDEAGRIGLFYPAKAEALGYLMQRDGQNDPIKVVRAKASSRYAWTLVTGLHRLKGCLSANLHVVAVEVSDKDDLRGIQASENVDRRELEPLERAMFVHAVVTRVKVRLAEQHGDVSQQALAGKARALRAQENERAIVKEDVQAARDNLSLAYGWNEQTAEACGLGVRDIKRSMRIYRCIVEPCRDLIDAFKDHPVAKNASALKVIARLNSQITRRRIIEMLLAEPGLTIDQAHDRLFPPQKQQLSDTEKRVARTKNAFADLGTAEFRAFSELLVFDMSDFRRRALRDALNAVLEGSEAAR